MRGIRAYLCQHLVLAVLVLLATLAVRALLPAGMMLASESQTITVLICADANGLAAPHPVAIPMKPGHGGDPTKHDGICPFASLAFAALGGADVLLLAAALGFVLALGFAPVVAPAQSRAPYLHPPLRGPPSAV